MDLQNTFYILGIIVMSITLILFIALVVAVFAIRAKINAIHTMIEEKTSFATDMVKTGASLFNSAKKIAGSKHG